MAKPEQQINNETNQVEELDKSKETTEAIDLIPPKYRKLPSKMVAELWDTKDYIDEASNVAEKQRRDKALEAIRDQESLREDQKETALNSRYSTLSTEQKQEFIEAQKAAINKVAEYLEGKKNFNNLSTETALVMSELKDNYEHFKENHPGETFKFDSTDAIDKRVYNNFIQSLAFEELTDQPDRRDNERVNTVRAELGLPGQKIENSENEQSIEQSAVELPILSIAERKKLTDWQASYELAKIAKNNNVNLESLSREEYAQFAIDNYLAISDDQLRMSPWQRSATSLVEHMAERKKRKEELSDSESDKAFLKFCVETKKLAETDNRFVSDRIWVRQGTKDSNSWLFFGVNESLDTGQAETNKGYAGVKDLRSLSPEKFIGFMEALRDQGYNGDVKIFQDLADQGVLLNDQIVMHGRTKDDSELAVKVAEEYFGSELAFKGLGKDEVIDGKNRSYSEILAEKIKQAVL